MQKFTTFYQPVDAPSFERYGETVSPDKPAVVIYIPLKKKL